ncbi:MAG TPA: GAF domain-containing protein, partial [Polyangiaceae bacterium]|nr:GAF domain-containing protein [Polyangiaceae bacterium]
MSEARFRLLVESVKDYAIFMLDPHGVIVTWNVGAERIKGYRAEEIIGQSFARFYPEEDIRAGKPRRELETAEREGRFEEEGWRIRADGTRFWASVVLTALRDDEGKLVGFAKVTRDLTERKRAEQERIRLAEQTVARESAERSLALLGRLHSLAGSLAAAHTPDEVAEIVVVLGAEALGARTGAFVRPGADGQLETVVAHGVAPELPAPRSFPASAPVPVAEAYRTAAAQWVDSPKGFADRYPALDGLAVNGSAAALPLVVGGRVIGVLGFWFDAPRAFPDDERALLQAMASHAAQALDRADAYAREVVARRRVELLAQLSEELSGALSTEDVARVVVDEGMSAAAADTCTLYALDERTHALELVGERGCNPTVLERIRRITSESGNPVYGTIRTGESVWAETPEQYVDFFPTLASMKADGPRASAFWCVPLVAEGRPTGLLGMGFLEPRRFSADDRVFVTTFARQCAQALLRARRLDTERTARAHAEKAQASLSTTLRSIGDAVIATDAGGYVTLMNHVAESLTGWSEAEARGRSLAEVFHIVNEHTRAAAPSPVSKVLEHGVVVGLANHTVLISRGGREVPIDDSGAPIRGQDGRIEGVVLVFRDVTDRKRDESRRTFLIDATAALAESLDYEATLRKVALLAVPQLADWCAVDIVQAHQRRPKRLAVAHVDPAKIQLARELDEKYPPDPDAPTGVPNVLRTARSELYREIPDELLVARCVDEEQLRIARSLGLRSAMIVPLSARGHVVGAMTFVCAESGRSYDEDDLRFGEELARRCAMAIDNARLYASEQHARRSADVANRAKDEFLAVVSHELRTPLNAIMGWAKMMSSSQLDADRRERAVETIERNAVAMAQLIEDLLDMSRIISGKMRLDVQRVELAQVIEAAIESIKPAAEAKGVRVVPALDPALPPVKGDPTRLQQIVWNLLSNAVKFTGRDGRVDVSLRRSGASADICVV